MTITTTGITTLTKTTAHIYTPLKNAAKKSLREVTRYIKQMHYAFSLAAALEDYCIPRNCIKGLLYCLPFTAQQRMSGCPTHTTIAVRTPSVSSYHWLAEWVGEYVRPGEPLFSSEDEFCLPAPVPTTCAVTVGLARRKFHGKSPARVSAEWPRRDQCLIMEGAFSFE